MSGRPTSVKTLIPLRLVVPGASSLPVRAGLAYTPADPYAVTVSFHTDPQAAESDSVQWTFARSLLTEGVLLPVGEGDVQVWPTVSAGQPVVCLALCSPSGKALFEVPAAALTEFLTQTYEAVPAGAESDHVDVDAELALLLWAEPET